MPISSLPHIKNTSSHDEAIATRGGMYGGMNGMGGYPMEGQMDQMGGQMMQMEPEDQFDDQYGTHPEDPPDADNEPNNTSAHSHGAGDDNKSVMSGTSSLMGGAQNQLKQNRMKKM